VSTGLIVGIVVVVIIVVLIGWGVSAYNNLVTLKNRVKNGWAQIDVQLKQRADLIPNLVNTVKGYASHESEVFTQVTAARAGSCCADRVSRAGATGARCFRSAARCRTGAPQGGIPSGSWGQLGSGYRTQWPQCSSKRNASAVCAGL